MSYSDIDLQDKISKMFPDIVLPEKNHYSFTVPIGWESILICLFKIIDKESKTWAKNKKFSEEFSKSEDHWSHKYMKQNPVDPYEDFKVIQAKQKFGELRFYCVGTKDRKLSGAIEMATLMSRRTCEYCGKSASIRGELEYVQTLCETHFKIRKQEERK